jgi:peptide alpha-N-acetyltransferase
MSQAKPPPDEENLRYAQYELEKEHIFLDPIRQLISKDLSEPYSIYVYRYFLNQWGDLCYMVSSQLFWVHTTVLAPH